MRRIAALPLLALLVSPFTLAGKSDVLWTIEDPRGDDRGEGNLLYPLESDMRSGDLDLLSLTAKAEKGGTRFEARFARPIPNRARGSSTPAAARWRTSRASGSTRRTSTSTWIWTASRAREASTPCPAAA